LFDKELRKSNLESPLQYYKKSNLKVAKLCNHRTKDKLSCATSKTNYLDPRITYAYIKKHNLSAAQVFSEADIAKHHWANDVESDFIF
jgi:DNA topoisomerase-1